MGPRRWRAGAAGGQVLLRLMALRAGPRTATATGGAGGMMVVPGPRHARSGGGVHESLMAWLLCLGVATVVWRILAAVSVGDGPRCSTCSSQGYCALGCSEAVAPLGLAWPRWADADATAAADAAELTGRSRGPGGVAVRHRAAHATRHTEGHERQKQGLMILKWDILLRVKMPPPSPLVCAVCRPAWACVHPAVRTNQNRRVT